MLFSDITFIDHEFAVREHAYIGISGSRITYVGDTPPAGPAEWGEVYPGQGKLLLSGFYNAHSHTAMTLLRGYGENMNLTDWLHKRIFPFEAHLTYNDIYWATLLGCAEMLRHGIVATTDMYMNAQGMSDGFRDGGVKANISIGVSNFDGRGFAALRAAGEYRWLLENCHQLDDGRLKVDMSLHAEYTSHEQLVRDVAQYAAAHGLRMHVHASETADEVQQCRARHNGRTPVQYLSDCGLFDVPATAAHCVHVTDEDIALLAAKRVTVATCPKSNLKLASGVCPAGALLRAGVNVAVSTDSVSSNNNLDYPEELRLFSILHKGISGDPTLISTQQALYAATVAGARSQGRDDCGAIKTGNRADLIVMNVDQPHLRPAHDLLNNLIFSAAGSDVVLTMVDGQVRYRDGQWPGLDMERIYAETDASCRRIIDELAQQQ